jgi:hypothetical protein
MWRCTPASLARFILTKAVAVCAVTAVPVAFATVLLLVRGQVDAGSLESFAPLVLLAFSASLFAGAVLPVDEGIGLSTATSVALALAVESAVTLAISRLNLGPPGVLLIVPVACVLLTAAFARMAKPSLP